MAIRDHLRDTTDTIQPSAPTPYTTGTVLELISGTLYRVQVGDEVIPMRSAGNNTLEAGTTVSVMYAGGDYPWCCDEDAGYRSLIPVALSEFFRTKPASAWMLYILQDNPRNYIYREGVKIGHPDTYEMTVQGLEGDTVTLPVEYAGTSVRADLIPIGDPVVMHQLNPQNWIVIGKTNVIEASALFYLYGSSLDAPLLFKTSVPFGNTFETEFYEDPPGSFDFHPPVADPFEWRRISYNLDIIGPVYGTPKNIEGGETINTTWPFVGLGGTNQPDLLYLAIRTLSGNSEDIANGRIWIDFEITYNQDSTSKIINIRWYLLPVAWGDHLVSSSFSPVAYILNGYDSPISDIRISATIGGE